MHNCSYLFAHVTNMNGSDVGKNEFSCTQSSPLLSFLSFSQVRGTFSNELGPNSLIRALFAFLQCSSWHWPRRPEHLISILAKLFQCKAGESTKSRGGGYCGCTNVTRGGIVETSRCLFAFVGVMSKRANSPDHGVQHVFERLNANKYGL